MTDRSEMAKRVLQYLEQQSPEIALLMKQQLDRELKTEATLRADSKFAKDLEELARLRKKISADLAEELTMLDDSISKDMTAGDVHVSNAGGDKPKPAVGAGKRKFVDMLAEQDQESLDTPPVQKSWSLPLKVLKYDPDQRLVFGWASVSTRDGQMIIDKQGDMILPEDLEKAAYDFVLNHRSQGDMHVMDTDGKPIKKGRMIESIMFTKQKQDALGIDLGIEGWFVGFYVDDDNLWAAHKRGERPEFSIGGSGKRINL